MLTSAARRSYLPDVGFLNRVASRRELAAAGVTAHDIDAQVAARRWQRVGSAIVLHNAVPTPREGRRIGVINCGPRAVLTLFTAAEEWGLRGWERREVHVLAPRGTTHPGFALLRLHRVGDWSRVDVVPARRRHRLAPALVIAAGRFTGARPGCGLLAAAVQQRLITPADLRAALQTAARTRPPHGCGAVAC